jgi:microcystin-dependent protein
MSIQIGAYDTLNDPKKRVFTNERLKLFSVSQSNLLEISSSCNETSLLLDNIQIGTSNNSSNLLIKSLIYDESNNRIADISKESTTFNSLLVNFGGNVRISSNITILGSIINNQPIQTTTVVCSNIQLYSSSTNTVPLNISSNAIDIVYLNTSSNRFIVLPNVGIGTTTPNYKLQVQGPIYTSDGIYGKFISSNVGISTVQVYGNLNVNGSLSTTETFNLTNTNIGLTGITINNTQYQQFPAISVTQQGGDYPIAVVNTKKEDGSSNTVYGISSSGRSYIGVDLLDRVSTNLYEASSQSNAMLTIALPYGYSNDNLLKTISYNTSNFMIVSSNAYIGMGTTIVNHPLHFHMQSNTNMLNNSLSNASTIGIYHKNMPNKYFMLATSNNTTVFSIDSNGTVNIGSNNAIYLGSNGNATMNTVIASNIVLYNSLTVDSNVSFTGFGTMQGSNIYTSNIVASNLNSSNITSINGIITSNIQTNTINSTNNATFNNVYIDGTLSGRNLNPFLGQSSSSYFSPTASNSGSVSHFKTSNVLISINSNYSAELAGALAGNSNGIVQIRTYGFTNNPISAGVSVYGYDYSSMLVTANRPYYQLQRPNSITYNIGINGQNEMIFGVSNNTVANDYTTTCLKIASNAVTIGNSKTFMYANSNGSILVALESVGNTPLLTESGGFEVAGTTYLRSGGGVPALFVNGTTGNVGIGNTKPERTLDITGNMIVSGYVGIGTTIPLYQLHVQENVYYNNSVGIGTTIPRKTLDVIGDVIVSSNIGIGTTLPRTSLDVVGNMLVSGKIGIGTTQISSYDGLYIPGDAYVGGSLTVSSNITAININGTLRGVANSAEVSSNTLNLTGTPNIIVGTILSSNINTNNNNINVGIGTVIASTFIGSNLITNTINTNNATFIGTLTTSNLIMSGSNTRINTYLLANSNVMIRNQTGLGPALSVYQSGLGSSYPVADFYDGDINTTVPSLRIADGGNIGLGTTIPVAKLHVQGTGYFSSNLGIGTTITTQLLHVQGNTYISGNVGIGTTIPLAKLHVNGDIISPVFTGLVAHFATSNVPTGWLKCNGASVARASYSNLFAVIGTVYGVGVGTTSFQVPDLRGVFIRGWADDQTTYDSGRAWSSNIQADDFKSHQHSYIDRGDSRTDGRQPGGPNIADDTQGLYTTTFTGGTETRPVNMALLACIKY